ncbi:MAG: stage II sporulation protein D [Negativibacillus sp.]
MRFYGICLCVMAVLLLIIPLLPGGLGKMEETVPEEPLVAVVDEINKAVPEEKEEKTDIPVMVLEDKIASFQIKNAATQAVDTVAVEDFVLGAVCSEMPASFHLEALKAQAVSARTWAVYQKLWQKEHPSPELNGADFQSDPEHWKGYVTKEQAQERFGESFEAYWALLTQAVEETKGQILCYEGEPIAAAYHAISAGKTESAEYVWGSFLPYLQVVDSRGDELAPGYEESVSFTDGEMKQIMSAVNFEGEPSGWLEILERSPSGYVTLIQVGDIQMSGLDFRTALGLRSSCFTITHTDAGFTITTRGYGHGAGLSQYGADFMARQGSSYDEILAYYYTGSQLCQW